MNIFYHILDWFFTIFHSLLIVFNLFGWIWKSTRKWNLATILLTAGSWLILGIFYGIGYCPLTDWHWDVLHRLGEIGLPHSYPQYLINRVTGIELPSSVVDFLTAGTLVIAFIISAYLNLRDHNQKKASTKSGS